MLYSGKHNGFIGHAIQWTGSNLQEVWNFLETYRNQFGIVGFNFNFVKELPINQELYHNCPIRLTNRETKKIETVPVGSWILRALDTSEFHYLFIDNETFHQQFKEITLQIGSAESTHSLPVLNNIKTALNTVEAIPSDITKPSAVLEKITTRMEKLVSAGFPVGGVQNEEEEIRLAAGVELLSRNCDLLPMTHTVSDLWKWFLRMIDLDCIALYSSIPVYNNKSLKIGDLPEPMLQFIIRYPVTDWNDTPECLTRKMVNDLKRIGKLLYTKRASKTTNEVSYAKSTRLKIMQQLSAAYQMKIRLQLSEE